LVISHGFFKPVIYQLKFIEQSYMSTASPYYLNLHFLNFFNI
jgi:hypothetical protein